MFHLSRPSSLTASFLLFLSLPISILDLFISYLSISISIFPPIPLYVHPFMFPAIRPSIPPCILKSPIHVSLSIHPSLPLFINLFPHFQLSINHLSKHLPFMYLCTSIHPASHPLNKLIIMINIFSSSLHDLNRSFSLLLSLVPFLFLHLFPSLHLGLCLSHSPSYFVFFSLPVRMPLVILLLSQFFLSISHPSVFLSRLLRL